MPLLSKIPKAYPDTAPRVLKKTPEHPHAIDKFYRVGIAFPVEESSPLLNDVEAQVRHMSRHLGRVCLVARNRDKVVAQRMAGRLGLDLLVIRKPKTIPSVKSERYETMSLIGLADTLLVVRTTHLPHNKLVAQAKKADADLTIFTNQQGLQT